MLRKYALFVGVAAIGALVTSCGGGNGGTPTPTDTSTATPTPTPSATTVDFSLTQDFSTQSVNANLALAWFMATGGTTETFNGGARVNGISTIALALSPESVTFNNPDLTAAVTFAGSELVSSSSTLRSYARTDESLQLSVPFGNTLQVTYEQSLPFTRASVDGTLRARKVAFFFNPVTTTSDITTDLTYTGTVQVAGGDPGTTLSDAISSPTTTFTVQASDEHVVGTLMIYELVNNVSTLIATLPVDAVVNSTSTFSGTFADTTHNLSGSFVGSLTGANRDELFILFSVSGNADASDSTDDRRYVGSFIGSN
ncbi:MAG: hypothetical protein KDE15_12300 [Erythrobacter sp.]|nr:hypothetical protein [Erythrobacter sp.]